MLRLLIGELGMVRVRCIVCGIPDRVTCQGIRLYRDTVGIGAAGGIRCCPDFMEGLRREEGMCQVGSITRNISDVARQLI